MASAEAEPTGGSQATSTSGADAAHDHGTSDKSSQGAHLGGHQPPTPADDQKWSSPGGWNLALPSLVPQTVQADHLEPGSAISEEDGTSLPGPTGSLEMPGGRGAVSFPEAIGHEVHSDSMEAQTEHDGKGGCGAVAPADRQCGLAHPGSLAEAAQSASVQALSDPAASLETLERQEPGKGQGLQTAASMTDFFSAMQQTWSRSGLRRCLTTKVFANYGNVCYANASVISLLWTLLGNKTFFLSDWGLNSHALLRLLSSDSEHISLVDIPWFRNLLVSWQLGDRQQDASEFTTFLVHALRSPKLQMRWEKRVDTNDGIQTVDHCTAFHHLTLQFSQTLPVQTRFHIQELIQHWHEEHGMVKALLAPHTVVCIHLDRNVAHDNGDLTKVDHLIDFFSGCQVPHFTGPSLNCQMKQYQVLAAIAHLGSHTGGHYRSLLRCDLACKDQSQAFWLTDDNEPMCFLRQIPDWFLANTTMLWLCCADDADLLAAWPTIEETALDIPSTSKSLLALFA